MAQRRPLAQTGGMPEPRGAPSQRVGDGLALTTFVALGLPDGMLGTAWPAMHRTLGAPVGDLGLVLLASTAGAVVVAAFVGALMRRAPVGVLLAAGLGLAAAASLGFSLAPGFAALVGVAALFGAAAGMLDGGLNTVVGLSGRRRLLNLLHGAYGVGTAIGPLVVTAAIVAGSWRPAYLVLLGLDVALAALWFHHRRRPGAPAPAAAPDAAATPRPGPRRGAVVAGMVVFFVYTGLEVGAGQWETSFDRLHLHLSASLAGVATFGYWAALTVGRLGLALLPRPLGHQTVVRGGIAAAVVATAVIWWQPSTTATLVAFAMLGAALAGIFPALIALTPGRLGERQARHAIAWQVGAASAGGAGLSAVIGALIGSAGLAVLGPSIVALAVLLALADLALDRLAPCLASGTTR